MMADNNRHGLVEQALMEVGIVELLQADGRPTMILDLQTTNLDPLRPAFYNHSLQNCLGLFAVFMDKVPHEDSSDETEYIDFTKWAVDGGELDSVQDVRSSTFVFKGLHWTKYTLRQRWRIVSGTFAIAVMSPNKPRIPLQNDNYITENREISLHLDWTRSPPPEALSSHIKFVRDIDWGFTPIGLMETWPPLLRSMCNMIMADPDPAAVFWGDSANMIYNEAFILVAGEKHPDLMGQHPAIPFAEVWSHFDGILENGRLTGESTKEDNVCLFLRRRGFLEEIYVSYTFTPLIGENDSVVGNYHTVRESTKQIIADRRRSMLLRIGQFTATAKRLDEYWIQVLSALETNENDIPFAVMYSMKRGLDAVSASGPSREPGGVRQCVREGSIGVRAGHEIAPLLLDLEQGLDGFAPIFREALIEQRPVLSQVNDDNFPEILLGYANSRGFGEPCRGILVCPLRPTHDADTLGFLAFGLNPRRPYDKEYLDFTEILSRQLATSLASTMLYEEERYRRQTAVAQAEINQAKISKELALRTQEIKQTELRFTRLTQIAPVGVFIQDPLGQIMYCNDKLYDMTGRKHIRGDLDWKVFIMEDDIHILDREWGKLLNEKTPVTFEARLRTPWKAPLSIDGGSTDEPIWTLISAYPEMATDGTITTIVGCITDISQQKWAEMVQQRRVEEALEAKRQQENFIDMTSHEIRNPLSAITQCADEIITTLCDLEIKAGYSAAQVGQLLKSSVDAAQTILVCAQHQKSVVDDILTLSKLDSNLLVTTPIRSDPIAVVEQALKMFQIELHTSDIKASIYKEPSLSDLQIRWLLLDSSRLLQVLINLITNAIKFTKSEPRREISVAVGALLNRPSGSEHNVEYLPLKHANKISLGGNAKDIFLHFRVTDTGCGISVQERNQLFSRFSQGSPRTHVRYGGSGLGLFICRELVELQGGQIGVTSMPHVGSTFAFYIRAQVLSTTVTTISDIPRQRQPPRPTSATQSSSGMTHGSLSILVVEDNLVNQQVLAKQLRNRSCAVEIANHGEEALLFIQQTRFWTAKKQHGKDLSVILMDIEMPVMDGLSCTREIRRLQDLGLISCYIPIIAITANVRNEQTAQAKASGVDEILSKPFRIDELMLLIEKTIQSREYSTVTSDKLLIGVC